MVHFSLFIRSYARGNTLERFSLDCRKGLVLVFYALWLASVFTLVLVLRQSSENRSTGNVSIGIESLVDERPFSLNILKTVQGFLID